MLVVPTGGTFCPNAWDIAYSIFLHCLYVPQRNHICRKTHFVFVSIKFFGVFLVLTEDAAELFSNPHFRITNANTHCHRIANPTERPQLWDIPSVGISLLLLAYYSFFSIFAYTAYTFAITHSNSVR